MDRVDKNSGGLLNAAQQNHFLVSLKYADQLLGDCEHILASESSPSLFPKYQNDVSLEDRERIEKFIQGLRALLIQVFSRLSIPIPPPQFRASHGVATNLDFIEMNFDELRPTNMRAYGELAPGASELLDALVRELQSQVGPTLAYLRHKESAR